MKRDGFNDPSSLRHLVRSGNSPIIGAMPRAVFTPAKRALMNLRDLFPAATPLSTSPLEDQLQIGDCTITCRYWKEGGDFVSKQMLGCAAAIRSQRLQCANIEAAVDRVFQTKSVIGIVGPESSAQELARKLATHFSGIVVSESQAELFEEGNS